MSQASSTPPGELERLDDTALGLADESKDIRGCKVIDRDGTDLGHVSSLFIDSAERKVRMLEIRGGGFLGLGDRHFLLPVNAITEVRGDDVHVNQTRDHIAGSPGYDPKLVELPRPLFLEPYYDYYGLVPYWGGGYLEPAYEREIVGSDKKGTPAAGPAKSV